MVISTHRKLILLLIVLLLAIMTTRVVQAQELPQMPDVYSGTAKLADGSYMPDNIKILARVLGYESVAVSIKYGRFESLVVSPVESRFISKMSENQTCALTTIVTEDYQRSNCVTFHAVLYDNSGLIIIDQVEASEVRPYKAFYINNSFDLTFDRAPIPPTPTPTPIPTATPTPIPTATPLAAQPAIFSGTIVVAGSTVPDNAELIAVVGEYTSSPAFIIGDEFKNLVIDPVDPKFIGFEVIFILNGIPSSVTVTFESGGRSSDLEIVFTGIPTPTSVAVAEPEAEAVPTNTPIPDTPTPVPTATAQPTPTPVATMTPVVVASVVPEEEPTNVPQEEFFGTCSSPDQKFVPIEQGMANGLLLVAPLGLIWAYRRYRRK